MLYQGRDRQLALRRKGRHPTWSRQPEHLPRCQLRNRFYSGHSRLIHRLRLRQATTETGQLSFLVQSERATDLDPWQTFFSSEHPARLSRRALRCRQLLRLRQRLRASAAPEQRPVVLVTRSKKVRAPRRVSCLLQAACQWVVL